MSSFVDFLESEKIISTAQVEKVRGIISKVREPIGSIAFSYGLLSGEDVDLILTEQRREHRQFGEIATALGILSRAQVDVLVRVQQVRGAVEVAEAVALAGLVTPDTSFGLLGRFLSQASECESRGLAA